MIWKVKKSQLYICGSIHVLKENQKHVFKLIDRIYSSSERIIFEADTTNLHLLDNSLLYYQRGCLLKEEIPRKLYKRTNNYWKKLSLAGADLNTIKPWNAANIILFNLLAHHGFVEEHGIDKVLLTRTKADKKNLIELEPINEPFKYFDSAPMEEQHKYLSEAVFNTDTTILEFKNLVKAILHDDIESLTSCFRKYLSDYPVLFNSLVIKRNARWLPSIIHLINDNIPTLVVVGAFHCVDSCGLPEHIRRQGYQVDFLKE